MTAADILNAMYPTTPLIFGHRGASEAAPANTIPAFELAVQQKAHGTELDVHRSKDGYPVVIHDFTVDATTNGTGRIDEMTLAELKALDAGSYFSADFAGVTIPTLDEVFEAIGQAMYINVEIKSMTETTDGVETVVADCIRRHNMQERVFISSFNPLALRRFRKAMPEVPIGFLYAPPTLEMVGDGMKGFAHEAVHPVYTMIDQDHVDKAHAEGQRVNAWTVNDVDEAKRLADLGVDAIITDAPDRLLAALG